MRTHDVHLSVFTVHKMKEISPTRFEPYFNGEELLVTGRQAEYKPSSYLLRILYSQSPLFILSAAADPRPSLDISFDPV